ncbi:putative transporter [Rhodobacter capsulatus]|uniref:TrkA domain transport protein n=1 Tax=Rhodobacter capsulatus (strain ATCC BAA-309 / NBRC 16581 / SB1003) TaxID=272942 RepID=D5ALU7_RHOCB|nr:putative transporter [Rhodobacter capsulatus]ADE86158.1 TrkA domain transport protein [Rhodobacter capsulatus SB 1003]ETD01234.1 transporter [Rhodobacter capsulatus DE442]ETD75818.1 transporter [Rhodobacter capsulatus R121]ETD84129.1 transporter [Rhodobacter capsulatus YW1]ETE53099.1 transporter [Rhodobacter capsulatus Y262]
MALLHFLSTISPVGLATAALALSGALGLLLGGLNWRGIGLGIGGVLFAGLFVGHWTSVAGLHLAPEMLEFVREFGLIIFVFTIGIQVGPGFFASLQRAGLQFNLIAAAIVLLGVATTVALHFIADIPVPALVGLMSGAVTNTPGLGAATQVLKDAGIPSEVISEASLGYAVAYPFGILGILLTMIAVRQVLAIRIEREEADFEAARAKGGTKELPALNVVVRNPNLEGLELGEVPDLYDQGVVVSRLKRGEVLMHPLRSMALHMGDVLHLVGPADKLHAMVLILGEEVDVSLTSTKGTQLSWQRVAVTAQKALGKHIRDLGLEERSVSISRVTRAGTQLPVEPDLALQFGDILTVVGAPADIEAVKPLFGDQMKSLDLVQFSGVFFGILLGVILGSIPIAFPGLPAPLKLGLAGGPLVAAILLSRIGFLGPFVFFMPPVANHALRELGIVLFLSAVGLKAGGQFVQTLIHGPGLTWMLYGMVITLVPLMIVGFVARVVYRVNYLSLSGVLAGSMTDPPALAFANGMSGSAAASVGYASVYPLVMCMRILAPQIIVLLLL